METSLSSMTAQGPQPSFHLFPNLPVELRCVVWHYAIVPRLIEPYLDIPADFSRLTTRRRPPPALLSTTRESRRIFLTQYHPFPIRNTQIYIHPSLDTLTISSFITDAHTHSSIMSWPLHQLSSIVYLAFVDCVYKYTIVCKLADEVSSLSRSGYTGLLIVGLLHNNYNDSDSTDEHHTTTGNDATVTRVSTSATPFPRISAASCEITQADNMQMLDLDDTWGSVVDYAIDGLEWHNPSAYKILRQARYEACLS
ncbi:hypothetical protein ACMFMG_004588 [Clarireedia jacksonii]